MRTKSNWLKTYIGHWLCIGVFLFLILPLIIPHLGLTASTMSLFQWISYSMIFLWISVLLPLGVVGLVIGMINPRWVRAKSRDQVLSVVALSLCITFGGVCISILLPIFFFTGIKGEKFEEGPIGVTMSTLFGAASLLLYLGTIIIGVLFHTQFETRKIIVAIWALGFIAAIFMVSGGVALPHMKREIIDAASQVCDGKGIEEAATYIGSGPHPVVVGNVEGSFLYEWTNRLPAAWWPESMNELELVACLEEEQEELIETCQYINGPPLRRYQYKRLIWLMEAKTGNRIAADIWIRGSVPAECPSATTTEHVRQDGSHVGFGEVRNWLSDFVISQR